MPMMPISNLPDKPRKPNNTLALLSLTTLSRFQKKAKATNNNVFGDFAEKIMNKISPQEITPLMNFQFMNEISTIPAKISCKDMVIYKTIVLKNTGTVDWPKNTLLTQVEGVKGQSCRLGNISAGKIVNAILIMDGPQKQGKFTSTWRLSYINDKKENTFFGENFTVNFEIEADKPKVTEQPKVEEKPKVEIKKVEETPAPVDYDDKIVLKAKQMKEVFPEADTKMLLEFISTNPEMSIEELFETYLSY